MPATRAKSTVIARIRESDAYAAVEVRVFGPDNAQRQCSAGQMEFDPKSYAFINVAAKDRRKKFDPAQVQPTSITLRVSLQERRTKGRIPGSVPKESSTRDLAGLGLGPPAA